MPAATIFDLFRIDLRTLPDDTFIELLPEINTADQPVQTFRKQLAYKECDLFDVVEVKVIDKASCNILIIGSDVSKANIESVKTLLHQLMAIYGTDDEGRHEWTDQDTEEFQNRYSRIMFGRSWLDYPEPKNPVSLRIRPEENDLVLTMWGVR